MTDVRLKRSIRTTNLLKFCFIVAPNEARPILKRIYLNDYKIGQLIKQLTNMVRTDLDIIKDIEQVRAHNNGNWMDLMRLAFKHAPEDARAIIASIEDDDKKVTKLLEELSNERH